nr:putative reverse transcriptase domain-containing protein [Tanacetum cinerariifolium]
MDAPTIPVSAEENLGDPIDIRVDIIHLEPAAAVAFPAMAFRARIKTTNAIEKITRNRKRQVHDKMEQQLTEVQESQRQDRENFRKLQEGHTFWQTRKLNPRYVGPFKVLEKVGSITYKLKLPQELSRVHNTFHVSNLKKCYSNDPLVVPLDGLYIDDNLYFVRGPEFTWEREDQFRKKYPHLFTETAPSSSGVS